MRVLIVHNRYRVLGGEDAVFEAEVRALREHGVEVFTEEFSNHDIPLAPGAIERLRLAVNTVWSRSASRRIGSLVREHQIDVVHFHNTFPLVSPAAYRAARRAGAAVVQTLHNYRPICANAMLMRDGGPCEDCVGRRVGWPGVLHACYQGSRTKTAAVVAMQSVHRLAGTWRHEVDRYLALTEFQRQLFMRAGFPPEKIEVKPNFVDFEPPPPAAERNGILFVGRLDEHKGLRVLFDAWERIPPGHRLTVVGEGPLEAELRERARAMPGVELTGRLDPEEVRRRMSAASALVVPSLWYEPFGLVAIEALACGTPVIASDIGGLSELVEDGRTGRLVPPGNVEDLAGAMKAALAGRMCAIAALLEDGYRLSSGAASAARLVASYRDAVRTSR